MKKLNATSLILSVCLSFSALADDVCKLQPSSAEKVVRIQNLPGYFFKVHPDGKYIAYIGPGKNILLNLETGEESQLPGDIDPVWSPDGKLLSVPMMRESIVSKKGEVKGKDVEVHSFDSAIGLFHADKIIDASLKGVISEEKEFSSSLEGVYQSIGVIDGQYRIVSDHKGASLMTLKIDGGIKEVSPAGDACGGMLMATDLPMISKDGRFLSVYSSEETSTKIYRFTEGGCELALDLGFPTGKVSFNNDSSQIAFHVDQFADFQNGYFTGISKDKVKNVVVMNLAEEDGQRLTPTSWALASQNVRPGDGGYYPDFDAAGNIYFMEDKDNYFQFVKTKSSLLEFRNYVPGVFKLDDSCNRDDSESPGKALNSLAAIWENICKDKSGVSLLKDPSLVLAIEPASCEKLIEDFWVASLGVSKKEMLSQCSKVNASHPTIVGKWDETKSRKAEEILQAKCIACHSKPIEYMKEEEYQTLDGAGNFNDITLMTKRVLPPFEIGKLDPQIMYLMAESMEHGADYPMPKTGSIDEDEKLIINEYFQRKYLDYSEKVAKAATEENAILQYTDDEVKAELDKVFNSLPPLTDPVKRKITVQMRCAYARKDCPEHHANELATSQELAVSLPQNQRDKFVKDRMMEIRCTNYFEVSIFECQRWKMQQAESEK